MKTLVRGLFTIGYGVAFVGAMTCLVVGKYVSQLHDWSKQ